MAMFEGSVQEFHSYIGPRIRNIINTHARKERNARKGVCEDCGKTGQELDSAHVHGRGRRTIIEEILSGYEITGVVRCDIRVVEQQILDAHGDISDAFRFLCKKCHIIYDNIQSREAILSDGAATTSAKRSGVDRVELIFVPNDERKFKLLLIDHKKAHVTLHKTDGSVDPPKEWNAGRFREQSNLRGNIFSGYLRDWQRRGIAKAVFAISDPDS
jgi:hypothetical protein